MTQYPAAAECLLKGQGLQECERAFTYPPVVALLMTPFVPLPMWARNVVWYAVTIGATLLSYMLCELVARRFFADGWNERTTLWIRALGLALSLKFILAVFENQSYDTLVFLLVIVSVWALSTERWLVAGSGLAVAAALKATPLIFLPYLLLKRRFMAACAFTIVFVGVSLLPDMIFRHPNGGGGYFIAWMREVAGAALSNDPTASKFAFWVGPNLLNHSLRGAVSHIVSDSAEPRLHAALLYTSYVAFIVAAGLVLLRSGRRSDYAAIDGSVLIIAMLVLSPMTSRSHYVSLLLPYAVLSASWMLDRRLRHLGSVVLVASFIFATVTSNDLVGTKVSEWAYGHGFLVMGALVLLVYLSALLPATQERTNEFSADSTDPSGHDRIAKVVYLGACVLAATSIVSATALFFEPILDKARIVISLVAGAGLVWLFGSLCLYLGSGRSPWSLRGLALGEELGGWQRHGAKGLRGHPVDHQL